MAVAAALGAALSAIGVAYSTPRPDMLYTSSRPLSPAPLPEFRRTDADLFEGVHSEASQPLTQRVLERGMPRSSRTPQWHTAPPTTAHAAQPTRHRAPVHRAPVPPGLTAARPGSCKTHTASASRQCTQGSSATPHPAATPHPGSCAQLTRLRLALHAVPELARREAWYAHPPLVSNGHVHTILAAKLRTTRAVRYHRQLLATPDGGLP